MKTEKWEHASMDVYDDGSGNLKCVIHNAFFGHTKTIEFFIPKFATDRFGFIPAQIIKYRAKKMGVELGHYTVCYRNKK